MKWVLTFVLALGLTTVAACKFIQPAAEASASVLIDDLVAEGKISPAQAEELRAAVGSGDFWSMLLAVLSAVGISVPTALGMTWKLRGSPNNRKGAAPSVT